MASNKYQPKPEHKFTFGLWTVGNRGRIAMRHGRLSAQ